MLLHAMLLVSIALGMAECTTRRPDREQYVRDGMEFGVTEGRFRGRWWNYYERGRSFQDGEFWEEAETDLRVALARRGKDQRWARTYGLHFTPEYFPHRELGITLFYQDRLDEAIAHLETSLDGLYSARAAYYLDEARANWVTLRNEDTSVPEIQIATSSLSLPISEMEIEVAGVARDDTFVRSISIGGDSYPVLVSAREISFSQTVRLQPGVNRIPIHVTDVAGKTVTQDFELIADHDGPAVSFDKPVVLPGIVRGVVYDPAGVKSLRVDDRVAILSEREEGLVVFEIELDPAGLSPPLVFRCEDRLGNATVDRVPLDTLVVSAMPMGTVFAASAKVVRVASGLDASLINGRVALLTLAAEEDTDSRLPTIEFTNIAEGQRYLKDEIVVGMKVASASPIERLEVNGSAVETLIPGRLEQRVSRRVRLEREGTNTVMAALQDRAGRSGKASVSVVRELTAIEEIDRKLSVAVLGNVVERKSPGLEEEARFVADELLRTLKDHGRFNLLSRELLSDVLAEKELIAALGSKEARAALKNIIKADLFVIGSLRRTGDVLEIILTAINTDTSEIAGYADVTGPAKSPDDLVKLVKDLALRLEQEFPRVQGLVTDVPSSERIRSDLSDAHRVHRNMKCIVFRKGEEKFHPVTGESQGAPLDIIADGLFSEVQEKLSTILVWPTEEGKSLMPIEVLDFVVTK